VRTLGESRHMTFRYLNPVLHEEVGVSSFSAHIRDENTAQI